MNFSSLTIRTLSQITELLCLSNHEKGTLSTLFLIFIFVEQVDVCVVWFWCEIILNTNIKYVLHIVHFITMNFIWAMLWIIRPHYKDCSLYKSLRHTIVWLNFVLSHWFNFTLTKVLLQCQECFILDRLSYLLWGNVWLNNRYLKTRIYQNLPEFNINVLQWLLCP